jgi:hypothetical protein
MGGSTTTSSNQGTSSTTPWGPQASQLNNAFGQAQDIYNQRVADGPYTGQMVAGLSAGQEATDANALGYAGGQGQANLNAVSNTSASLLNGSNPYAQNAANLAMGVAGPNQGAMSELAGAANGQGTAINGGLSSALNGAAVAGANNIAGYNAQLQNTIAQAGQDPTQQLAADAGQYMNSAPIQQALTSTNAAINNTLNDTTLPALNRTAALDGGENSSRAGAIQGMDTYNAATALGSADASINNNAFNTGLGTAAQQRTAGLQDQLQGAESGIAQNAGIAENQQANNLATQQMQNNAANSQLSQGLGYEGLNAQTQEAGNAQLGNATQMGLSAAEQATQMAGQNYGLGAMAGANQQQGMQAADTNAYDQYQQNTGYQQNALNAYYGIVGGNNWGGNTTSSSTGQQVQQASTLSDIMGGISAVGGLAAMF